jgi:hypothetical protein
MGKMASRTQTKRFFWNRTSGEIKRLGNKIEVITIADAVKAHLDNFDRENYYVDITKNILPEGKPVTSFSRHGPILFTRGFKSVGECLEAKIRPFRLIRNALNNSDKDTLGYVILPPVYGLDGGVIRDNLRPIVVAWREPFEAGRVVAYAHQERVPIEVESEFGTNPEYEGLTITGHIPSRTKKMPRHKITLTHVPCIPLRPKLNRKVAAYQFYVPLTIQPSGFRADKESELLEKRRYRMMSFGRGPQKMKLLPVMWADIALYYDLIRREAKEVRSYRERKPEAIKFYPASLEFTPFPLITRHAVRMYLKFRNNTLNYRGETPNDPELNFLTSNLGRQRKYGRVFFSYKEGRIQDYDWHVDL